MEKKGQIVSLDFVFSLVLVMLALGLVMRAAEANNYKMKQDELFWETQRVGRVASAMLLNHEDFSCEVQDEGGIKLYNIINCADKGRIAAASKSDLLIPDDFKFRVEISDASGGLSMGDVVGDAPFVYSEERKALTSNGPISKKNLENCMSGACGIDTGTVTLWVWRSQ